MKRNIYERDLTDYSTVDSYKEYVKEQEAIVREARNELKQAKEGLKILKENEELCRKIREWAYYTYRGLYKPSLLG